MYRPDIDGDAEYLELLNIGTESITLYDPLKESAWRFTDGIAFDFPADPPVTMAAGERLLIVRDEVAFRARFPETADTVQLFQWTDSGLSNGGERVELSSPGDVDDLGIRQWVRTDRVNYGDSDLWPLNADGIGLSLTRVEESGYGNDVINWMAADPTPGTAEGEVPPVTGYDAWAQNHGLTDFEGDADGDGLTNGLEYALGLDPKTKGSAPSTKITFTNDALEIAMPLTESKPDIHYEWQVSENLIDWRAEEAVVDENRVSASIIPGNAYRQFVRLVIRQQ